MSARGGTREDMLTIIRGLQARVDELCDENRALRDAAKAAEPIREEGPVVWRRADVEELIADAEADARRTKRTHYVGAIGFPDGSQIYGPATLGVTDDKELIFGLGTCFATCEPDKTTRHS